VYFIKNKVAQNKQQPSMARCPDGKDRDTSEINIKGYILNRCMTRKVREFR
jgi:hypothetical protein